MEAELHGDEIVLRMQVAEAIGLLIYMDEMPTGNKASAELEDVLTDVLESASGRPVL